MDKKMMSEKLCALSNNEIINRRQPIFKSLMIAIIGVVFLVVNRCFIDPEWESTRIGIGLLGWLMLLIGGVVASIRSFQTTGIPYDLRTGEYFRYEELYFTREQSRQVVEWCRQGDEQALRSMSRSSSSAIIVALYSAPKSRWIGCQPYEYAELEYRPLDTFHLHHRA